MPVRMPHTAKAIVFTCIDERLEPAITTLLESRKGGAFHAALAGGGAAFTTEPDRAIAIKQIVMAYEINHITEIYLQSHLDCGAYRLAGITFASVEEEATRLYADLDVAVTRIKQALAEAGSTPREITYHTDVIALDGSTVVRPSQHILRPT